jgi:hypothetical protein
MAVLRAPIEPYLLTRGWHPVRGERKRRVPPSYVEKYDGGTRLLLRRLRLVCGVPERRVSGIG